MGKRKTVEGRKQATDFKEAVCCRSASFRAGVSNSRPQGRMRPIELLSAAPQVILKLLMNFGSTATDNCRTNAWSSEQRPHWRGTNLCHSEATFLQPERCWPFFWRSIHLGAKFQRLFPREVVIPESKATCGRRHDYSHMQWGPQRCGPQHHCSYMQIGPQKPTSLTPLV